MIAYTMVRINRELYNQLTEAAKADNRSVTNLINHILKNSVKNHLRSVESIPLTLDQTSAAIVDRFLATASRTTPALAPHSDFESMANTTLTNKDFAPCKHGQVKGFCKKGCK